MARKGTIKRRKQIRQILSNAEAGYQDDALEDDENIKKKENIFSFLESDDIKPKTKKWKIRKSPKSKFQEIDFDPQVDSSDFVFRKVDRNEMDSYISHIQKAKKKALNESKRMKKKNTVKMKKHSKRDVEDSIKEMAKKVGKITKEMNKNKSDSENDSNQSSDYYWSDLDDEK
ncbi:hypothetical protein M0811_04821 [Anaeramoeba ignava]|uniref:Uncharacterized protein n=1 Tax=Anaeramoeba ignava TaxID=1746090 RepID=A0A9Q0LTN3_ANAIG|nr:hypothetical protein M0811_04821 [Anaeramoeba ignava]